jgi:hypothetical protein
MVKKIFLSAQKSGYLSSAQVGTTQFNEYIIIALFDNQSNDEPKEMVFFDKTTAVSFVNELKRQIAKIDKHPF